MEPDAHSGHTSTTAPGSTSASGINPLVLDVLQNASSPELFQLSMLIERLLADPRRIIAVRNDICDVTHWCVGFSLLRHVLDA